MKKVALLSVYDVYNYGSVLQTYAMQQNLFLLGFENQIIRNDHRSKFSQFKRLFNLPLLRMKINFILRDFYVKYFNKDLGAYFSSRRNAFDEFISEYLNISADFGNKQGIASKIKDWDYALVGSDQVWNPMNLGKDFYTMSFIPNKLKRITYAPSFGVSAIPPNQIKKTKSYLSKIDCISVRETSGREIIKELIGRDVPVVADPTILLPFEKWEKLVEKHPYGGKPYILCYFLGTNASHRDFANRLSKREHIDIIALPHSDEICKSDFNFGSYTPHHVGPKEFINLVAHANYVCTDSFHCTVFSNLFSKQFFSFGRYKNNADSASTNGRIPSLLKILGNDSQYIDSSLPITEEMLAPVNFDLVQKNLDCLRKSSLAYLKDALDLQ